MDCMHPRLVALPIAFALVACADLGDLSSGDQTSDPAGSPPACGVECATPAESTPPDKAPPPPPVSDAVTVLSATEQQPHDLFVSDGSVYWVSTETRQVRGMAKGSSTLLTIDTGVSEYAPSSVYVDESYVYWSELFHRAGDDVTTARIRRASRTGSPSSYAQAIHPSGVVARAPLAGDADRLYSCARYSRTLTEPYWSLQILGITKPTAPSTTSTIDELGGAPVQATRLALGASVLFGSASNRLHARSILTSSSRDHEVGGEIAGLATRGDVAFVTVPSLKAVLAVDATVTPTSILTVVRDLVAPSEIAADSSAMVWVTEGRTVTSLASTPGAVAKELARTDHDISSIAMDAEAIYVATATSVLRITR